jgi:hypothetical protein
MKACFALFLQEIGDFSLIDIENGSKDPKGEYLNVLEILDALVAAVFQPLGAAQLLGKLYRPAHRK